MYNHIHFFDNSHQPGEKSVNPINLAMTPARMNQLTAEGRTTSMHQLDGSLYYPNLGEGVMPLEFTRGIDENDAWEASQRAQKKVREFAKHKSDQSVMTEEH